MENVELNKIVDAWIAGEEAGSGTPEYESNWWALEQVMDWSLDRDTEKLWQFVLLVYKRDVSKRTLAVLAAGPLEDVLAYNGSNYIDRVEHLAQEDEKFNWLLGGVWRSDMTDEIWERVQAARNEVW
jgi:uncharacterized protein DUF6869